MVECLYLASCDPDCCCIRCEYYVPADDQYEYKMIKREYKNDLRNRHNEYMEIIEEVNA